MKTLFAIAACLAGIGLAGCAGHAHRLASSGDSELSAGWFNHLSGDERAMILELGGQRFEGRGFEVRKSQNLAELRRRYGSGKHYDRIFSGLDTDHYVYSADPILRSEDGSTLRCSMVWRASESPVGNCTTAEGRLIELRFE